MTAPIEPGSLVRVTKDTFDVYSGEEGVSYHKGFEFEVEALVRVQEEWKGNDDYVQVDFYEGNSNGGWSNVHVAATDVELVKTPQQMRERTGPTLEEITYYLGQHLDRYDRLDVNYSDVDVNDGTVEFGGRMDNGLEFAFTVKITDFGVVDA